MSKSKNRNSLLSSHSRSSYSNSTKDNLISMKYEMNKPVIPLYPFNDSDNKPKEPELDDVVNRGTYPDFVPWREEEHDGKDVENTTYLTKGYFESPMVSNEYYSSRNLIHATLFSSSENCNDVLTELSQHLANAYKTRNEQINKIRYESNNFKIPSRVTLTASKREIWLKDLANPEVPLHKIAGRIPHGIRNKLLIDSICSRNVPISRAIWFTKCVLFAESIALRKKHASKLNVNGVMSDNILGESFETHWLQDWTQQAVDFIYKYSKELGNINQQDKKNNYMNKLKYLLEYIQTLYIEGLLDKTYFLSSIFKFLKEGLPLDPELINGIVALKRADNDDTVSSIWLAELGFKFGERLVAFTIIKIFWLDILKFDFLCKELSELLLLNYFFIDKISTNNPKHSHNHAIVVSQMLKQQIQDTITDTLVYLFKFNTNFFIIPTYWILVNEHLFKIMGDEMSFADEQERFEIQKQLQLIKYRNESLMLNMRHIYQHDISNSKVTVQNLTKTNLNLGNYSESIFTNSPIASENSPEILDNTQVYINRSSDDVLRIISQLDKLKPNEELAELLKPKLNNSTYSQWKVVLRTVIFWCIAPYRLGRDSNEDILIICNFLKRKVLQKLPADEDNTLKMEFENEILEIVYTLSEDSNLNINMYKLYVLINELYQLQVITISSYLRKLIASGIIYTTPGNESYPGKMIQYHLSILQNLPVLNNKQCDNILKKWNSGAFNFREKFNEGKEILQEKLIDKIVNNSFDELLDNSLGFFKDLEVGLKFLLINWLTNQLKITITNSPKLIHITTSIITALYNFYSMCDNLTVFFKGFIKFLLRNKGKVIIGYLDSLYLISCLIMKHFSLVKSIAGTAYEPSTTAYELFKLVVINYKDLLNQDHDYFQSKDIWNFMETVIENDCPDINTANYSQKLLVKDQIDTPMIINVQDTDEQDYSSTKFRSDLEMLLDYPLQLMKHEEVKNIIEVLGLDSKAYDFGSEAEIRTSLTAQLSLLYRIFDNTDQTNVLLLLKILSNSKNILETENLTFFKEQIHYYILDVISEGSDIDRICMFSKKLIAVSFVKIEDLISSLKSLDQNNEGRANTIIYAILFGCLGGSTLSNTEELIVSSFCEDYMVKYLSTCLEIVVKGLCSMPSEHISESYLWRNYKDPVLKFLNQVIIFQTKTFIEVFFNAMSNNEVLLILNEILLGNSENMINSIKDISNFANQINEFNLPIVQALLKFIIYKETNEMGQFHVAREIEILVGIFLDNCTFYFSPQNSYFGELFNYLDGDHKVEVLNYFEDLFLRETVFLEEPPFIRLTRQAGARNIQPILKGFFKKFSSSTVIQASSSDDFFNNIGQFLQNLLILVGKHETDDNSRSVYFTISIFLRILIIHQSTLTTAIIEMDNKDFWFVKNLISLLNTKFMCTNEKLRILLYDLLLLLKSSVTSAATVAERATKAPQDTSLNYSLSENTELADGGDQHLEAFHASGKLSNVSQLSTVFNLPEPHKTNPLKNYIDSSKIQCVLMLERDELEHGGDIHSINNSGLVLVDSPADSAVESSEFAGLKDPKPASTPAKEFKLKSFELLKDTSTSLNDGCINISLFDSYTTRENPP